MTKEIGKKVRVLALKVLNAFFDERNHASTEHLWFPNHILTEYWDFIPEEVTAREATGCSALPPRQNTEGAGVP
jgi:hypothetical protein